MRYALAGDLGGTSMRTALVDEDGRIQERHSTPTQADSGPDVVLERFLDDAERLSRSVERSEIVGIGAALAGPIDPATGVLYNPPNLPGWDGFSPKAAIERRLALRATLANDATAAALAEHRYGAGRGYDDMIYMTVSTGIGGGIVVDGKLVLGSHGYAGEIGHLTIDPKGPRCNCGNLGCLESFSSGTAVARVARERLSSGADSVMLDLAGGDLDAVSSAVVAEATRAGDAVATEVMDNAMTYLGIGIVGLIHVLNPGVIVIGGGMSNNFDLMLPTITREIKSRAMAAELAKVSVVKSELGDEVGLIGAAAMAFAAVDSGGES